MTNWVEQLTTESKIIIVDDNGEYKAIKVGNNLLVLDGVVIGVYHNKLISKRAMLNDVDCPIKQYTVDVYFKLIANESKLHKIKYIESYIHHLLNDPTCVDSLIKTLATKGQVYRHPRTLNPILKPDFEPDDIRLEYSDLDFSDIGTNGILIYHIPTGISAQSTNERSSYKNREMAMSLLRANIIKHLHSN